MKNKVIILQIITFLFSAQMFGMLPLSDFDKKLTAYLGNQKSSVLRKELIDAYAKLKSGNPGFLNNANNSLRKAGLNIQQLEALQTQAASAAAAAPVGAGAGPSAQQIAQQQAAAQAARQKAEQQERERQAARLRQQELDNQRRLEREAIEESKRMEADRIARERERQELARFAAEKAKRDAEASASAADKAAREAAEKAKAAGPGAIFCGPGAGPDCDPAAEKAKADEAAAKAREQALLAAKEAADRKAEAERKLLEDKIVNDFATAIRKVENVDNLFENQQKAVLALVTSAQLTRDQMANIYEQLNRIVQGEKARRVAEVEKLKAQEAAAIEARYDVKIKPDGTEVKFIIDGNEINLPNTYSDNVVADSLSKYISNVKDPLLLDLMLTKFKSQLPAKGANNQFVYDVFLAIFYHGVRVQKDDAIIEIFKRYLQSTKDLSTDGVQSAIMEYFLKRYVK